MIRHLARVFLFLAISMAAATLPSVARAESGVARGSVWHWNMQGNFCLASRNCTGAKYPQSQYNTYQPVRNVKVYVRDQNSVIIGQGTTNTSGDFLVAWFRTSAPTGIHITWHAEHYSNRFVVYDANGGLWNLWSYNVTPVLGGITEFGGLAWGSSGAPLQITNWYDGAEREWRDALVFSTRQFAYFTGVTMLSGSSTCDTSCASGSENKIWLDVNSWSRPQARVMHEMGHIADDRSHRGQDVWQMVDYCYPSTGTCLEWSLGTAEWSSATWAESIATFFADAALWDRSAVEPYTCYSEVECPADHSIEYRPANVCVAEEYRMPITVTRILWDFYDTNADWSTQADGTTWWQDVRSATFEQMVETLYAFPDGRSGSQKNEGWTCPGFEIETSCSYGNRDARNIADFRYWYAPQLGISDPASQVPMTMNCQ